MTDAPRHDGWDCLMHVKYVQAAHYDTALARIAQLETLVNQIVMAASYQCEQSVETLEAALAFIKMTAREALAPKEPT